MRKLMLLALPALMIAASCKKSDSTATKSTPQSDPLTGTYTGSQTEENNFESPINNAITITKLSNGHYILNGVYRSWQIELIKSDLVGNETVLLLPINGNNKTISIGNNGYISFDGFSQASGSSQYQFFYDIIQRQSGIGDIIKEQWSSIYYKAK